MKLVENRRLRSSPDAEDLSSPYELMVALQGENGKQEGQSEDRGDDIALQEENGEQEGYLEDGGDLSSAEFVSSRRIFLLVGVCIVMLF